MLLIALEIKLELWISYKKWQIKVILRQQKNWSSHSPIKLTANKNTKKEETKLSRCIRPAGWTTGRLRIWLISISTSELGVQVRAQIVIPMLVSSMAFSIRREMSFWTLNNSIARNALWQHEVSLITPN